MQRDRRVEVGEEPERTRKGEFELSTELLGEPGASLDEVLAGPDRRPQRHGLGAVGSKRAEAMAVGPQDVGQDQRVGAIVLVAGAPIPAAKGLDVTTRDHHDVE